MATNANMLARWATEFEPGAEDLALAQRSLLDTAAVALAARSHPVAALAAGLPDAARWAAIGHVLDFDDLHIESTTHISVVIVPAVLATGGDARAYLAGAGVMARLGNALGWPHYSAGWHATAAAGAPAAAVAAGTAMGLSAQQLATAMALAIPGACGVQDAFGTHGKSLQVGFAAQAGVRAARLAAAGATAEPGALDTWLRLVTARSHEVDDSGPAVPGGLAIKVFPCCYAMQRPIAALRKLRKRIERPVERITIRTPKTAVQPLIHDRPRTGLAGKFSLPYALATAVLDAYPDFGAFTDAAVNRPQARRLLERVEVVLHDGGDDLLAGKVELEVRCAGGTLLHTHLTQPPGSPARPPSRSELDGKLTACGADVGDLLKDASWRSVGALLRTTFPAAANGTE